MSVKRVLGAVVLACAVSMATGVPCGGVEIIPILTDVGTATDALGCLSRGAGRPVTQIPSITNCTSPCHQSVVTLIHTLSRTLAAENCTLGLGSVPAIGGNASVLRNLIDSLGGGASGVEISADTLEADAASLTEACQGGGVGCSPRQMSYITPRLESYTSVASCLRGSPPGTALSQIDAVTECASACHNETVNMLNTVGDVLRREGCALTAASIGANNQQLEALVGALLGGKAAVNGSALEAEAFLLASACGSTTGGGGNSNGGAAFCSEAVASLVTGSASASPQVCAQLQDGSFGPCYCQYVQQQQVANQSLFTAQELSNEHCHGVHVPDDCYPMTGDCAAGATLYPQCAQPSSGGHHPANSKGGGGHDSASETDAIIISVTVSICLLIAVFGSLAYSRIQKVQRLEAIHAMDYVNDDDDDDEGLLNAAEDGAVGSPGSLKLPANVYEDGDSFEPTAGENHYQ